MEGWIKLHRKILESSISDNPNVGWLFIHLLLRANRKPKKMLLNNKETIINEGQLITGRKILSKITGLSEQQIRSGLTALKSTNTITIKSTNKFSLITVLNWKDYQEDNQQVNQRATSKQPTNNQQITTNKNIEKEENVKNLVTNVTRGDLAQKDPVNEFISKFVKINPSYKTLYPMKGQRLALERLINEHGREKVELFIDGAIYAFGKPYSPTITTPFELEKKLGALTAFLQREKWQVSKFSVTKV